jgi:mRNA interferase MazF
VTCKPFEVVVVAFPFTDRRASKRRPALAVSSGEFSVHSGHTILAMITSAVNPPWSMDVPLDSASAGLKSASKVRMKLFTLDNRLILQKVGQLSNLDRESVARMLRRAVGFAPAP